jgi:hypothetical protein
MIKRYLVEQYWPGVTLEAARATAALAHRGSERASTVSCVDSTLLIVDETVFYIYEGYSAEDVTKAALAAGVVVDRVTELTPLAGPYQRRVGTDEKYARWAGRPTKSGATKLQHCWW